MTRHRFCQHHRFQPLLLVIGVISFIAGVSGIYQDLIKPYLPTHTVRQSEPPKGSTSADFLELLEEFLPKRGEPPSWTAGLNTKLPIKWDENGGTFYEARNGTVAISTNGIPTHKTFRSGRLIPGEWHLSFGDGGSMFAPDGALHLTADSEIAAEPTDGLREAIRGYASFAIENHGGTVQIGLYRVTLPTREPCYVLLRWSGMRSWWSSVDVLPWDESRGACLVAAYNDLVEGENHNRESDVWLDERLLLCIEDPEDTVTRLRDRRALAGLTQFTAKELRQVLATAHIELQAVFGRRDADQDANERSSKDHN